MSMTGASRARPGDRPCIMWAGLTNNNVRQGRAAVLCDVGGSGGTSGGVMIPIGRLQIGRKRGFAAVPDAGSAAEGTAEGSELRVATTKTS